MQSSRSIQGRTGLAAVAALLIGLSGISWSQTSSPSPVPGLGGPSFAPPAPEQTAQDQPAAVEPEVLTRGPVHEAFAEPVDFNPEPGPVISKEPPPPVEELPPDLKPEGDDVEWIPGYWAWDDALEDYLWVSGIWRRLPPGRQWVPGYWEEVEGGFRWISGYWAPSDTGELEYLPAPPQSLEAGPNVPAPSGDSMWVPGYWSWYEERYVWAPGSWAPVYPDWIWVPPTYYYTPGGCVFVPGYWDYALANRGMLFAPVYFPPAYFAQAAPIGPVGPIWPVAPIVPYTPTTVININILPNFLFCRPSFGHYYFGDYYGTPFLNRGYQPWFSYHHRRFGYDPIYAWSERTIGRRDPGWSARIRESYQERLANAASRPAPTLLAQQRLEQRGEFARERFALAQSLTEARNETARTRLVQLDQTRRQALATRQQAVADFRQARSQRENQARARLDEARAGRAEGLAQAQARRVELPRSPLVARTPAYPGGQARAAQAEAMRQRFDDRNAIRQQQQAQVRDRVEQAREAQAAQVQQRQERRQDFRQQTLQAQAAQVQQRQDVRQQAEQARAAQVDQFRQRQQALQAGRQPSAGGGLPSGNSPGRPQINQGDLLRQLQQQQAAQRAAQLQQFQQRQPGQESMRQQQAAQARSRAAELQQRQQQQAANQAAQRQQFQQQRAAQMQQLQQRQQANHAAQMQQFQQRQQAMEAFRSRSMPQGRPAAPARGGESRRGHPGAPGREGRGGR